MIHDVLKRSILEAAARVSGIDRGTLPAVSLGPPADVGHGDLSTKMAFPLAKMLKRPPLEVAKTLAAELTGRGVLRSPEG